MSRKSQTVKLFQRYVLDISRYDFQKRQLFFKNMFLFAAFSSFKKARENTGAGF